MHQGCATPPDRGQISAATVVSLLHRLELKEEKELHAADLEMCRRSTCQHSDRQGVVVQVRDMSLNEQDGKLVACSCNNSFVGVWVVELNKIRPFSGPAVRSAPAQTGKLCDACCRCCLYHLICLGLLKVVCKSYVLERVVCQ